MHDHVKLHPVTFASHLFSLYDLYSNILSLVYSPMCTILYVLQPNSANVVLSDITDHQMERLTKLCEEHGVETELKRTEGSTSTDVTLTGTKGKVEGVVTEFGQVSAYRLRSTKVMYTSAKAVVLGKVLPDSVLGLVYILAV